MLMSLSLPLTPFVYDTVREYFVLISLIIFPITLYILDAPFGRFAPKRASILTFDGRKSWIFMELISPISFTLALISSSSTLSRPQLILSFLYYIHYTNRALISPLRTPSRSRAHIIVPLSGVAFNVPNGLLLGTYITLPTTKAYLEQAEREWKFWVGIAVWFAGFVGNVVHDEILINLRKGKVKPAESNGGGEHYAIPHGLLFKHVSFPNYFCEWVEWFGFALAASPLPLPLTNTATFAVSHPSATSAATSLALSNLFPSFAHTVSPYFNFSSSVSTGTKGTGSVGAAGVFAPQLTPPWIFLFNEIVLMYPRALRGHKWYKRRFGDQYPRERRVVVPGIL